MVERHARAHEIPAACIQRYSSSLHNSVRPAARPKRREAAQRSRKGVTALEKDSPLRRP